jgi:hypothetical protein
MKKKKKSRSLWRRTNVRAREVATHLILVSEGLLAGLSSSIPGTRTVQVSVHGPTIDIHALAQIHLVQVNVDAVVLLVRVVGLGVLAVLLKYVHVLDKDCEPP